MAHGDINKVIAQTPSLTEADNFFKDFFNSPSRTVQVVIFFSTGMLLGFLCKRYGRYIMWGVVLSFLLIKWFEHQQAITVNWTSVYVAVGLGQHPDIHGMTVRLFEWFSTNWITGLAGVIGFLMGYKPEVTPYGVKIKIEK